MQMFKTRQAAESAIASAVSRGKVSGGFVVETWQGPGGTLAFRAHVHFGQTGWCL